MNKVELFHASIKAERWRSLNWRLAVFNLCHLPKDHEPRDYDIDYPNGIPHYYLNGEWVEVEGATHDTGLYHPNESFTLEAGMWGDDSTPIVTSYGRAIANYTVWFYSFGSRFPFVNENTLPDKWLDGKVSIAVDDDKIPESGEYITASEVGLFIQGILELKCLAKYITPTGTEVTLSTHPEMKELRESLIEQNKDHLDVPSVVADIIDKLDQKDMEWLQQDESALYYDSPKARNRRRKLYVIEGISSAFRDDGSYVLQANPLMDRWKKDELVAKFNETREGSFQRGAETAKGGEKVTFLQSTFQNHLVVPGDCGAKPLTVDITSLNKFKFLGLNAVIGGKLTPITKTLVESYLDKPLAIRRSFLCKKEHIDVCAACANEAYAESPHAIANEESSIGSYTMYGAMGAMHAVDLKVAEFIPMEHIA